MNSSYTKQVRQWVIVGNWVTLCVVVLAVLGLVWYGPGGDATNTAIGLFSTIAGMVIKNSSTIVDYVFGGSASPSEDQDYSSDNQNPQNKAQ